MVDTKITAPVSSSQKTPEAMTDETLTDPNLDFYRWLNDHDYKVTVEALSGDTPFLPEHGFVLTDKPLLVVKVIRKENK